MKYRAVRTVLLVVAVAHLSALTVSAAAQQPSQKGRVVTFRGCVEPGVPNTTFRITKVSEITPGTTPPAEPVQVVYWMDNNVGPKLEQSVGARVEVTARITEESDRDLLELTANDGVFAFETKMPAADAAKAVGTSGTSIPAPDTEMRTVLLKIDVDGLKPLGGACR